MAKQLFKILSKFIEYFILVNIDVIKYNLCKCEKINSSTNDHLN